MQPGSGNVLNGYRVRKPKTSPLWQCLNRHFDAFLVGYEQRFQPRYGYLRPIVTEVVNKFHPQDAPPLLPLQPRSAQAGREGPAGREEGEKRGREGPALKK